MKYNLNDTVKFEMTDYGREILITTIRNCNFPKELFEQLCKYFQNKTVQMRIIDFITIFGAFDFDINNKNICENNEIEIIKHS